MKNLLLLVSICLFTLSSFAQSKTFEENITKLMVAKNGMKAVNNMGAKLVRGIADQHKTAFTNKLNTLKSDFLVTAMTELKNEYTNEQITAIYTEFTSDEINYAEQTNDFFRKYRKLKGQFFKSAKELYFQYQE